MKGKSPMMKALVGKQNNLPDQLKAKILSAPESPAKMMKKSPAKMKKASPAKVNPFSAEYKKMTVSQRKNKYGENYKSKLKGAGKKDITVSNVKESLGKTVSNVKKSLGEVNTEIQKGAKNLDEKLKAPKTLRLDPSKKDGKLGRIVRKDGSSEKTSSGYNSIKGEPRYTYKKNTKTGGYDFIDSKTNKKGTIKSTNKKAMDKLNSAFPMKKK